MNNKTLQTIGNRIKIAREKLGLSQSDLSRIMHLSRTICGQWERGVANPSTLHLSKLADVLGVSFEYLVKGVEPDSGIRFNLADNSIDEDSQNKILTAKILAIFNKLSLSQKRRLVDFLEDIKTN